MAKPVSQDLRKRAALLERAGRFAEAEKAWAAAVRANPKDPKARLGYARWANRAGVDPGLAVPHVTALLKLAPKAPEALQEAAETYCRLERFVEAKGFVDQGLKVSPKSPDMLYVAATVADRMNRHHEAAELIAKALDRRPGHMPTRLLQASILISLGDMDAAQTLCRELFAEEPDRIDIARIYVRTGKMQSDDPIIAHVRDTFAPSLPDTARRLRALSETLLGKVASDEGRHTDAFDHYAAAKRIDPAPYDLQAYRRHVSDLTRGIARPAYLGRQGHSSDAPLLIVGMPRSGSTLLEQILSGHPDIAAFGESASLRNAAGSLGLRVHDGAAMSAAVGKLSDKDARALGDAYLEGLGSPRNGLRFVDKRLHNFELLGLFARLFPKGRVLHTMRDPMDNCVSIYMQSFRKTHGYAWKLEDLGRYYQEYRRLMRHWKQELPLAIEDVQYEDTVADLEATARRVIDFVGLPWSDGCLAFQDTKNVSRTLSQWQVRQPIYTSSVARWRRYGDRVEPLKQALAPLYPGGFDGD